MSAATENTAAEFLQVRQLYSAGRRSIVTGLVLGVILVYLQRDIVSATWLYSWFLVLALVTAVRYLLTVSFRRTPEIESTAARSWLVLFRFGVLASGIVWGSSSLLVNPSTQPAHMMYLIFMLAGVTAGATITFAIDSLSVSAFSVLVILPLCIRLLVAGDGFSVAMAAASLIYIIYIVMSARYVTQYLLDNVSLQLEATERGKAVRASEERFRLLASATFEGIAITERGRFIDANDQLLRMLGYGREDLIGYPIEDLLLPEDRGRIMDKVRNNRESHAEHAMVRKDGSRIQVEGHGQSLDRDGHIIRITALRDITERKRSEAILKDSETRFRTVIEQSPIGMAFAKDGITVDVNAVYLQMFGYDDIAEVCGHPLTDQIAPPCRAEMEDRILRRILDQPAEATYQTVGLRRDGSQFPLFISAKRVVFNDGPLTYAFLIDFTEREMAEERIRHLAFHDPLTDLPNRQLFNDRLQHALASSARSARQGALLFIDLDNFKILNDTLGHNIGDLLLKQVAQRLTSCLREGDSMARLGGDEFVVMLENLSENGLDAAAQTEAVGEKVLAALAHPFQLGTDEYHCTSSVGATLFRGHQQAIEELLKQADIAMYQAKKAGRNTLRFFDPQMQDSINIRVALEADLRQAVRLNQFLLYYQPQIDGDDGTIGGEALIRWQHPRRGLVSPAEFIPIAEESGLILALGQWVLNTACAQLVVWAARADTAHLTLAVNISAPQLYHREFVEQVLTALHQTGANPAKLKLELTESMLLHNVEDIIAKMSALKALGISFSLDDFGTGYSSLSYLKRLPLDQLKIDQSFVRDILTDANDAAIARTIVALAQSMGLDVIAEGVETEEQRKVLAHLGCHSYQGYLFSRPLPIEEFDRFVQHSFR